MKIIRRGKFSILVRGVPNKARRPCAQILPPLFNLSIKKILISSPSPLPQSNGAVRNPQRAGHSADTVSVRQHQDDSAAQHDAGGERPALRPLDEQ